MSSFLKFIPIYSLHNFYSYDCNEPSNKLHSIFGMPDERAHYPLKETNRNSTLIESPSKFLLQK